MKKKEDTKEYQLERATISVDAKELWDLHKSQYMNVRRAVAKNININSDTANSLILDPVLNVSYMASENPNCSIKREFCQNSITVCVECLEDERNLNCKACEKLVNSSLIF